ADALRPDVRQAEGRSLRRAGGGASGEAVAQARQGTGLRAEEDRSGRGRAGGPSVAAGIVVGVWVRPATVVAGGTQGERAPERPPPRARGARRGPPPQV